MTVKQTSMKILWVHMISRGSKTIWVSLIRRMKKPLILRNGLLNIYESGENIYQLTYKRVYTTLDQKCEYIQDIIPQSTSCSECFRFIHKYIQGFCDIWIYHLDTKYISFVGVNITDKYLCTCTKERQRSNKYDKNEKLREIESDDN